ncbi:CoA transferase [Pigmentiphaga litoralis]|uniref:CoA transferase n=1 Tax=Pigmentiphaga litoralis TaxID=516702 RepID=UPI003B438557
MPASAAAIAAAASSAAARWSRAHGVPQHITIDAVHAACALEPTHFQTQHGHRVPQSSHSRELKSGFYRTQDDHWFIPSGSYPHLRDATLQLLDCPNTAQAIGAAISRWRGADLEEACHERGVPGTMVRSRDAWLTHTQGRVLAATPVIVIEKIANGPRVAERPSHRPLDDIRVLDLSHVIAGPVVARSLGEYGAQVLRVSSPGQPDPIPQILDTGIGKRNACLDLRNAQDHATLLGLAGKADVFVESWRQGSFERLGLSARHLAEVRPGIVYVSVNAFGFGGPWLDRKGFDQMAQAATGICDAHARGGKPALVPTRLLNDYLTGYLGAAGVMQALALRARDGGSYHVKVSLARTAMWVQDIGQHSIAAEVVTLDDLVPPRIARQSPFGLLHQVAPAAQLSVTPGGWDQPPAPLGAHAATWQD